MTARRADIADLPDWPRGLSLEQAAAYVGVSADTFLKHVNVAPRKVGGRSVWDRRALDAWFDTDRSAGLDSGLAPTMEEAAAKWGASR